MMTIYRRESGVWVRVGQLSPVDYDTDEKIIKGIKKLESRYLFDHYDYMVQTPDYKKRYFMHGTTWDEWIKTI